MSESWVPTRVLGRGTEATEGTGVTARARRALFPLLSATALGTPCRALLEEAALTSRKLRWWGAAPAELISLIRPLPSQAKAALRKRMKTMGGPRAWRGKPLQR